MRTLSAYSTLKEPTLHIALHHSGGVTEPSLAIRARRHKCKEMHGRTDSLCRYVHGWTDKDLLHQELRVLAMRMAPDRLTLP